MDAGVGTARVKLSFDAWKEGRVRRSEHLVRVVAPRPGPKPAPVSPRLTKVLIHPDRATVISATLFSPDGKWIIAGGYPSGGVQIWDAKSGKELRTIRTPKGYRGTSDYLNLAPDGRTAFVSTDRIKTIRTIKDGKRIYRWEHRGEVQVWDLATAQQLPSLTYPPGPGVNWIALSPDGRKLLAVERTSEVQERGVDDVLTLWDVPSRTHRRLADGWWISAFAPDAKTLAARLNDYQAKRSILKLWDVASCKERAVLGKARKASFGVPVFSPDGRYVATSLGTPKEQPPEVKLWDVATAKEVGSFAAPQKAWYCNELAFSRDGRWLATTLREGKVFLYDVARRRLVRTQGVGKDAGLRAPVFSPDGRWLATAGLHIPEDLSGDEDLSPFDLPQPRVFLFDLTKGGEPDVLVTPHGFIGRLAFSPGGKTLALGGYGCVWLFDVSQPSARR